MPDRPRGQSHAQRPRDFLFVIVPPVAAVPYLAADHVVPVCEQPACHRIDVGQRLQEGRRDGHGGLVADTSHEISIRCFGVGDREGVGFGQLIELLIRHIQRIPSGTRAHVDAKPFLMCVQPCVHR